MGIIVFSIGFVIVEVENKRSWSWSLKEVGFFIGVGEFIIILVWEKGLV